jgi:cytochrome c oxidase subunit II
MVNASKRVWLAFMVLCLLSTASLVAQSAPRTIDVHVKRFAFVPDEITIKKGEPVTIVLTSDDVTHSLVVKGLNVNSEVSKGTPVKINITADKAGDFAGECGHFCGSGHGSMVFVVHVTEN